mmetsp:Transcript_19951/g.58702  ORF Transcript_19951/g.58702 Transcript_19951/m.58702 type:complete len:331 (-) Transcript_19951:200-1192(-)
MSCPLFDPLAWRMAYFSYPSCFLACAIFLLVVIVKSASRVGVPAAVRSRGGCPSSDSTPPVCVSGRYIRLSGGMTPLFSLEQSVKLRLGLSQAGRVVSFYCRPFCLLLLRPPLKRRDRRHLLLEIRLDCLVGREKGDQLPLLHSHLCFRLLHRSLDRLLVRLEPFSCLVRSLAAIEELRLCSRQPFELRLERPARIAQLHAPGSLHRGHISRRSSVLLEFRNAPPQRLHLGAFRRKGVELRLKLLGSLSLARESTTQLKQLHLLLAVLSSEHIKLALVVGPNARERLKIALQRRHLVGLCNEVSFLLSQCLTERCNVLVGTAHLESKLKW